MKHPGDTEEGKKYPNSKFWDGYKPKPVSHNSTIYRNTSAPFQPGYHVLTTHAFTRAKAQRKKHSGHGSKCGINELLRRVSFPRHARILASSTEDALTGWGEHCCRELCVSKAHRDRANRQDAGGHPNSLFSCLQVLPQARLLLRHGREGRLQPQGAALPVGV